MSAIVDTGSIPVIDTGQHYTVKPGDMLSSIAPQYDESWPELYQDNVGVVGDNPNLIYPGQVLAIHPGTGRRRAPSSPQGVTVHSQHELHAAHVAHVGQQSSGAHAGGSAAAQTAVAWAKSMIGTPYLYGGDGPGGIDCSGLTSQAWLRAGVSIPRTADEQWHSLHHVSLGALQPGDIIAFGYSASYADHVGLYVGGGMLIDTATRHANGGVAEEPLSSRAPVGGSGWHILGAVRPDAGGAAPSSPAPGPVHHHQSSPAPHAVTVSAPGGPASVSDLSAAWQCIVQHESGGQNLSYGDSTSTGYFQIQQATWDAYGGQQYAARPYEATLAEQYAVSLKILAAQGPSAWTTNAAFGCGL
jgi:cell wall-associated NlpC family hydrolase